MVKSVNGTQEPNFGPITPPENVGFVVKAAITARDYQSDRVPADTENTAPTVLDRVSLLDLAPEPERVATPRKSHPRARLRFRGFE